MASTRYAVALLLDDGSAASVRALAEQLDALPRTAPAVAVPPHVTLAVCTQLDVTGLEPLVQECVEARHPLAFTLASLGIFLTPEGVVFLGVAPSPELVEMQAHLFRRLGELGAEVEPYWIPGQWVPHCTLATGLAHDVVPVAVGRIVGAFTPITGFLTRISVVEVESTQMCYQVDIPWR